MPYFLILTFLRAGFVLKDLKHRLTLFSSRNTKPLLTFLVAIGINQPVINSSSLAIVHNVKD